MYYYFPSVEGVILVFVGATEGMYRYIMRNNEQLLLV